MRKWVVTSFITALFLSMITTSQASFDSIKLADFPKDSHLHQAITNEQSQTYLNHIVLLPKNLFNQQEAADIINRIGTLPESVLTELIKENIVLKLFTGNLTDNPTASHLAGIVPRGYPADQTWDNVPGIGGSKVVLVKIGSSEKGQGHSSINLELHEMGHSIDRYLYNNISQNPEFKSIWEQERGILFPGNAYFIMHSEEYFAETYAMYYFSEETKLQLRSSAPQTFFLIKSLN
ncbi:toxin [Bacillus sp. MRMR6]|uniref:anthrax toxin lethal factor-related metalloendopeptidase n=1 Tax=Bacillus sp. MRMR6 TaxID=1928617 RepID=UPI00095271F9|nr:toxin [Bacillus sp. MRMR6]OLS37771.1 toxin [Bacillus sp. MRMR6]